jgi:hypothetical protein
VAVPLDLLGDHELARLHIVRSTDVLMPAPTGPGYVDEPTAASLTGPVRYFTDDGHELAGTDRLSA